MIELLCQIQWLQNDRIPCQIKYHMRNLHPEPGKEGLMISDRGLFPRVGTPCLEFMISRCFTRR